MYRALYRKWRPQRFEDVVGQRAIVTALKNQITAGRVGHAYLFTGVRGTGKTTCAKIFAKAVNCLHPVNGDPCGECEICKGIDNGSLLDVVEMDAASNNGVDDIRDLRDETAYTPSACQYKVYIIDEVHMLSTAAFNALLKTLEEPPAHVIFILATTEIQKVPATILSRCQRYDFTRIGPEDIARRVEYIAGEEKLELSPDGAELIARLADGALRDALSILDTCAGVTAKIDADVVRRMAGVTDRSYLFRISDALEAQDGATALAQLAQLRQQSVDVKRLTEELIAHYRALMLAALPGGQSLLSGVSPEEEALYLEKGPQLGQREAIRAIRTLGTAGAELQHRAALGGPDDTVGLGGDQTLVVDGQQGERLDQLRLDGRCADHHQRLLGKHRRTLRNGVDIAGEAEVPQIVQEFLAEQVSPAEIGDVLLGEVQVLDVVDQLLQTCRDGEAAAIGHLAEEHVEIGDALLAAGLKVAVAHGQLIEVTEHGHVQLFLSFHSYTSNRSLRVAQSVVFFIIPLFSR